MNKRALLSVVLLSVAASACALLRDPAPGARAGTSKASPCVADTCEVFIDVTVCTAQRNDIKAVPDVLYVGKGNRKLHWRVKQDGFTFVDGGIGWKDPQGKSNFQNARPGSRDWTCDNGGKPGTYPYGITLRAPDGQKCHVDPSVVND